jgi:autotransporter-associated beta strand protein
MIVPGFRDAVLFGPLSQTTVSLNTAATTFDVGEWIFTPHAPHYVFTIGPLDVNLAFEGAGIEFNGGSATIIVETSNDNLLFFNQSSPATATIDNSGLVSFEDLSTAGSATIGNGTNGITRFFAGSSGGTATISAFSGGQTLFFEDSTGGDAWLIAGSGGTVDFSNSAGPGGNNQLTAGAIDGAGTFLLGSDQLTVGLDGRSTKVSGLIDGNGGTSGSLIKVGPGTLTLSHSNNTYAGGTTLVAGGLDLAAVGAAGSGAITFAPRSHAKLTITNTALSGNAFGNAIDGFGRHDILDVTGLHFHAGASAVYHPMSGQLKVHSLGVTDTLALVSPHSTHFAAVSDGHGGTDVLLLA